MSSPVPYLVVKIDAQHYGLLASEIETVIRLVNYCPLPDAPPVVIGVIDYHGTVLPVVSLRRRFRHADRSPQLSDHLIIARTPQRRLALLADEACGLQDITQDDCTALTQVVPTSDIIAGVVKHPDGFLLIHDLSACLGWKEERALSAALQTLAPS